MRAPQETRGQAPQGKKSPDGLQVETTPGFASRPSDADALSRMGVKVTQPSDEVRSHLRAAYEQDSAQLIASSHVIAAHFQTVAAANNYWR